jgi:hypothetical protein
MPILKRVWLLAGSAGEAVAENLRGVDYMCRSDPPNPVYNIPVIVGGCVSHNAMIPI